MTKKSYLIQSCPVLFDAAGTCTKLYTETKKEARFVHVFRF